MEQRRRVGRTELGPEVVAQPVGKHEVGRERAGGDRIGGQRLHRQGRQHALGEQHRHDDGERRGRQQSASPPTPEVAERHGPAAGHLAEDQPGDEEAGDDEEHVDADKAAADPGHADVEGDDGDDGDCSQSLDVRPEPALDVVAEGTANHPRWGLVPRVHPWRATYSTGSGRPRTPGSQPPVVRLADSVVVGAGWSTSRLSSIRRCGPTVARRAMTKSLGLRP